MEQCRLAAAVAEQWPHLASQTLLQSVCRQRRLQARRQQGSLSAFLCLGCGRELPTEHQTLAENIEMIHTASLIHDESLIHEVAYLSRRAVSNFSKEEFVQVLQRQGARFVRGSSRFRGVTLHKCGKWEARIGQLMGDMASSPDNCWYVYLGLCDTGMETAKAYEKVAIKCCGGGGIDQLRDPGLQRRAQPAILGMVSLILNSAWAAPAVKGPAIPPPPVMASATPHRRAIGERA